MPMSSIYGQNFRSKVRYSNVPKYLTADRKFSEAMITREQRSRRINPFQLFHTSLRSTYDQKMVSKRLEYMARFLRQKKMHIKTKFR